MEGVHLSAVSLSNRLDLPTEAGPRKMTFALSLVVAVGAGITTPILAIRARVQTQGEYARRGTRKQRKA